MNLASYKEFLTGGALNENAILFARVSLSHALRFKLDSSSSVSSNNSAVYHEHISEQQ